MKKILNAITILLLVTGFFCCEKDVVTPKDPVKIETVDSTTAPVGLSGVYIGQAKIWVEETQRWPDQSQVTLIRRDEIVPETLHVTAIDISKNIYSITRTSDFTADYDFATVSPPYPIELDQDSQWHYSYRYDKVWSTTLQFYGSADSLAAEILQRELCPTIVPDSTGIYTAYEYMLNTKYSVEATR